MSRYLLCLSLFVFGNAFAQDGFVIKGDVGKVKEQVVKVYLNYYADGSAKSDSADVVGGKYSFRGKLAESVMASLRAKYKEEPGVKSARAISYKRDVVQLFIGNSKISVNSVDSFGQATVKGSKPDAEYKKIQALTKAENEKMSELNKQYGEYNRNKDVEGMKRLEADAEKISAQIGQKNKEYLMANPSSPIAMYAFRQFVGYDINADVAEPVFLALSDGVRNSPSGVEMAAKIEVAKKTGVGKPALDFTQNDTLGNPVSLSSFRGKYVLVDFWASWCGPCRKENPNVVAAYAKYNNKGFDVLGVSLDQPTGKEKWMKAIHDDKLTWTQVSDLKYWKNDAAVLYGIQAIPQNYLIDPKGIIVGKNLRGDALLDKLEELFK